MSFSLRFHSQIPGFILDLSFRENVFFKFSKNMNKENWKKKERKEKLKIACDIFGNGILWKIVSERKRKLENQISNSINFYFKITITEIKLSK